MLKNPILITGAARSGTSLTAGAIHLCGAFGGRLSGGTPANPKGMFENTAIRNTIVKAYLKRIGVDPLGQYPLPDRHDMFIPNNWASLVEDVLRSEGYQDGPVMYKGAKMTLMWPIWHHAFPDAKWIIVRRRTAEILDSCQRTSFMRAFRSQENCRAVGAKDEREGWLWWVHQHEKAFVEMIEAGLNVKVVWPERMVTNDFSQMMETVEWLGLKWNQEVLDFVSPKLWKARQKRFEIGPNWAKEVRR